MFKIDINTYKRSGGCCTATDTMFPGADDVPAVAGRPTTTPSQVFPTLLCVFFYVFSSHMDNMRPGLLLTAPRVTAGFVPAAFDQQEPFSLFLFGSV